MSSNNDEDNYKNDIYDKIINTCNSGDKSSKPCLCSEPDTEYQVWAQRN